MVKRKQGLGFRGLDWADINRAPRSEYAFLTGKQSFSCSTLRALQIAFGVEKGIKGHNQLHLDFP